MSDKNQNKVVGVVIGLFIFCYFFYLLDAQQKVDVAEARALPMDLERQEYTSKGCSFVAFRPSNGLQVIHHPTCKNPNHR